DQLVLELHRRLLVLRNVRSGPPLKHARIHLRSGNRWPASGDQRTAARMVAHSRHAAVANCGKIAALNQVEVTARLSWNSTAANRSSFLHAHFSTAHK
ncbi:MAG: hypothetical protein WCG92_14445, partial [Hyphomicrobiales bacterium]